MQHSKQAGRLPEEIIIMIPGHKQFIEAIHARHKVCVRFYSLANSGVVDRVCAPLDFGRGEEFEDRQNRYWLWNYASNEPRVLSFTPAQVLDLRVLGEPFESGELQAPPGPWCIDRDWGSQPLQPKPSPLAKAAGVQPETDPANASRP